MHMQELVNQLYNIIFKKIAKDIDPLVKENKEWTVIESSINKWFDRYNVLDWCFKQVNALSDNGTIFYNQSKFIVSARAVCDSLEEDDFIGKIKIGIMRHYGKKVPQKIIPKACPPDSKLVANVYLDGTLESFDCEKIPKDPDDLK